MGFTAAIGVSEAKCAHAGYMERYTKSLAKQAVAEYAAVAKKHGLTPTQLALAWCKVRACHTTTPIQDGSCLDGSPYRGALLPCISPMPSTYTSGRECMLQRHNAGAVISRAAPEW